MNAKRIFVLTREPKPSTLFCGFGGAVSLVFAPGNRRTIQYYFRIKKETDRSSDMLCDLNSDIDIWLMQLLVK